MRMDHTTSLLMPDAFQKLEKFIFVEGRSEDDRMTTSGITEKGSKPAVTVGSNASCTSSQSSENVKHQMPAHDSDDVSMSSVQPNSKSSTRKQDSFKSVKKKYTPLEEQYLEFKKENPNTVLFIECGYKYRLFGDDAEIASRELNIGCYMNHNFLCASIPTHRLSVHVRRLVANGYKVGVVKQTETAALKALGDSKNTLFARKLDALYTRSTLIGEEFNKMASDTSVDIKCSEEDCVSGYLMCVFEQPIVNNKKYDSSIGIVAVNPSTGDVLYEAFEDVSSRSHLETCLSQINPVELILPVTLLGQATEDVIKNIYETSAILNSKIHIERTTDDVFDYTSALKVLTQFFGDSDSSSKNCDNARNDGLLSLEPTVLCCLPAVITYLQKFHLESVLIDWRQWKSLSNSAMYVTLNAITVKSLELLKNSSDSTEYGSLFWTINHTGTKFGEKLLKSWLMKPLKDIREIKNRQNAVSEIVGSSSSIWNVISKILSSLPNVEKLLCSAFYHRCSCLDFLTMVKTLSYVRKEFMSLQDSLETEVQNSHLRTYIVEVITLLDGIEEFTGLNEKAAKDGDKTKLFPDTTKYPLVANCEKRIQTIEQKLNDLKADISVTLRQRHFEYVTVMSSKYLIEVKNAFLHLVPLDWIKINSTKQVGRFRSPAVENFVTELRQLSEELCVHCNKAWESLLDQFGACFYRYKTAVSFLAQLDCILSLSKLAKGSGYCRPIITDDTERRLHIVQGRNPISNKLLSSKSQYVANDTTLDCEKRCMIITGPNMGGKSTYVRQVALISILALIGSYVPADSAEIPLLDSIFIRMGADDNVICKRSTFMTEMLETSEILSSSTHTSLVILDELGRGTSTHDGAAIAYATLNYLVDQIKCTTLFVTHYSWVAESLQEAHPRNIMTCHMSFFISSGENEDDIEEVTFLYSITEGIAPKSYGINVARLAGIDSKILLKAKQKSLEFQTRISQS